MGEQETQQRAKAVALQPQGVQRRCSFKIVVKRVERPHANEPEEEFRWLCESLGFFEPIDRDKTASNLFREIVFATERGAALTSTALAQRTGMSRGAVINHLNNLIRSGLVVRSGRYYSARAGNLMGTIEELQEDVERIFSKMRRAALGLDKDFRLSQE